MADKFFPDLHLQQPAVLYKCGFTYSALWTVAKNKERIQKFKEMGSSRYIYQNELD